MAGAGHVNSSPSDPLVNHIYLSAACLHGHHEDCNAQCEFCPAVCCCELCGHRIADRPDR
jgi:protein involved in temperature-dependent protein secretion